MKDAVKVQSMPPTATAIALWGHATRVLTLRGFLGKGLVPKQSSATGCHSSTSFARALTKEPLLQSFLAGGEGLSRSVHAGDIAQEAQGTTEEIFKVLGEEGQKIIYQFSIRGLEILHKCQLIATDRLLAQKPVTSVSRVRGQGRDNHGCHSPRPC